MTPIRDAPEDASALRPVGAVDIGGSHVAAAVVAAAPDSPPRVLDRASASIDTHGAKDVLLGTINATLRSVAAGIERWTVAMPGPFDYERGTGTFEGVAKFSTLVGLDLRGAFSAMLGVAPADVAFINDAVAYGIGEWSVSDTRPERFACFTLGTGIGSAFLASGVPVESGSEVPPHGWAHLLEIDGSPLEDVVSTRAIQRRYRPDAGPAAITVREIAERARGGEDHARDVLDAAMCELGQALAPWVTKFRATHVVVGGSMARSWDLVGPAFERGLQREGAAAVSVQQSRLFDDAPLIGAAVSPTR